MPPPSGFEFEVSGDTVVLRHHGRVAAVLRGRRAQDFLVDVEDGADLQELMARLTGNYRHGNERVARHHPRNRPGR